DGATLTVLEGYESLLCRRLEVATGKELSRFEPAAGVNAVLSPRGDRLALSGREGTVRVLDSADGRELLRLFGRGNPARPAFGPPHLLAVADRSDSVRVHDARDGRLVSELARDGAKFRSALFAPDGRSLAAFSQSEDEELGLDVWDLAAGKERFRLTGTRPDG